MTWLVFAAAALLGAGAAAPGVSFGDAGEFAAAAATLSPAHPPGYPLYALAGKAFGTVLPWGLWAWRMSLFSALCAAGALALSVSALRRAGAAAVPAALGAAFLGLSPVWLHSMGQAEVFGPHVLLAAACLWAAAALPLARAAALLGLLLGLGTGLHHTLALAVPPLALFLWLRHRPSPRAALRAAALLALFGLLGFSVQLALPLRSRVHPPLDWGHPADLSRFLRVFLRRDYGSLSLTIEGAGGGGPAAQTLRWLGAFAEGFGPAGAGLAALGLGLLLIRRRPEAALAGGLVLSAGPAFLWLGDPPFDPQTSYALERFWLLPWLGAAWLAAVGADALWSAGRSGRGAVLALFLAPALSAWRAAPAWGQRWDLAAHDYGRDLLRTLPPGAALFIDGGDDTFYTLAAALYADGLRPDLAVADRGGLVFPSPYGPDFRSLGREEKEARRRRVELAVSRTRPTYYATLDRGLGPAAPEGLLRRAGGGRAKALWEVYAARHTPALERAHYRYRALTPFYPVMRAAVSGPEDAVRRLRAAWLIGRDARWVPDAVALEAQWAGWAAAEAEDWPAAAGAFALAAEAAPRRAEAWTSLGAALERLGRPEEGREAHRRAVAARPDSAQARFNLGASLYAARDYAAAAAEFAEAARLGDPKAAHWARRAEARR